MRSLVVPATQNPSLLRGISISLLVAGIVLPSLMTSSGFAQSSAQQAAPCDLRPPDYYDCSTPAPPVPGDLDTGSVPLGSDPNDVIAAPSPGGDFISLSIVPAVDSGTPPTFVPKSKADNLNTVASRMSTSQCQSGRMCVWSDAGYAGSYRGFAGRRGETYSEIRMGDIGWNDVASSYWNLWGSNALLITHDRNDPRYFGNNPGLCISYKGYDNNMSSSAAGNMNDKTSQVKFNRDSTCWI